LEWARQDSIRVADSLKKIVVVKKPGEVIIEDSLGTTREKTSFSGTIKSKHYIIVGSFTNYSNAGICARKYFSKGYKTDLIETKNRNGSKTKLVSVRSFENIVDAKKYLNEFHRDIDPAAWIYSQN
jgi:hypothetical protein